jgi:hypothetical protein
MTVCPLFQCAVSSVAFHVFCEQEKTLLFISLPFQLNKSGNKDIVSRTPPMKRNFRNSIAV